MKIMKNMKIFWVNPTWPSCASWFAVALGAVAGAQTPAPNSEAAQLSQGWALLERGDAARASTLASSLIAQYPRSEPVLVLALEADLARGGSGAALETYERWLGKKTVDAPYALRRVARALLRETGGNRQDPARVDALKYLAGDGDPAAAADLMQTAARGGDSDTETAALAAAGSDQAVQILIAELKNQPGRRPTIIDALAASHNRLAIRPLMDLLADPNMTTRAAAADALGKLGATEAIDKLKPLLADPEFTVHLMAAGALYRLQDPSGSAFLHQLAGSEIGAMRIVAAEAMAGNPDPTWRDLVRTLTTDPQPSVRLTAARLLAPFEPENSKAVLELLLTDENANVRAAAAKIYLENVAADFGTLRRFMRSADSLARVRAAARVLELTR